MQIKKPHISKPKQGHYYWGTFRQYCLDQAIRITDSDLDLRNPYIHELVEQYQRKQNASLPMQQVSRGFSFVIDDPTPPWDALILGQHLANARDKFLDACKYGVELKAHKKAMRRLRKRKNAKSRGFSRTYPHITESGYLSYHILPRRTLCS